MINGYMPSRLPTSCLTMAPRFDTKVAQIARRGPLQEINKEQQIPAQMGLKKTPSVQSDIGPTENYLRDLQKQLASVIATNPAGKMPSNEDECEDPKAVPMVWISKWVDYSDKYGFGYALCDESIGVCFNDLTKLLLLSDGRYNIFDVLLLKLYRPKSVLLTLHKTSLFEVFKLFLPASSKGLLFTLLFLLLLG
jgi:polo-like kinase 1